MDDKELINDILEELPFLISQVEGSSSYSSSRDRPYDGQPQTNFGGRGKHLVEGLTFRDVMDCFIAGLLDCCGIDQPDLYDLANKALHGDMYKVDLSKNNIDPGAWWQNMACRMEKMMGIYPNVPPHFKPDGPTIFLK